MNTVWVIVVIIASMYIIINIFARIIIEAIITTITQLDFVKKENHKMSIYIMREILNIENKRRMKS